MPNRQMTCWSKQTRRRPCPGTSPLWPALIISTLVLAIFNPVLSPVAMAEEERPGAPDTMISAQQMEDSINRALAGNQAELTELEEQLKQLETL